jgi:hypothetical protein
LTQQVHWLDFNKGILLLEMHGTNIKKKSNKFKSAGLHEKLAVATWSLGNHLSIRL